MYVVEKPPPPFRSVPVGADDPGGPLCDTRRRGGLRYLCFSPEDTVSPTAIFFLLTKRIWKEKSIKGGGNRPPPLMISPRCGERRRLYHSTVFPLSKVSALPSAAAAAVGACRRTGICVFVPGACRGPWACLWAVGLPPAPLSSPPQPLRAGRLTAFCRRRGHLFTLSRPAFRPGAAPAFAG